jgi:hypothetical protein
MTAESRIRQALAEANEARGTRAEIAKAFEVSPSTVKRWVDGGDIPPPMMKLLDYYFFGVIPPRITAHRTDPRAVLDFDEGEWLVIQALARREGISAEKFIVTRIRAYLAWQDEITRKEHPHLAAVADAPATYPAEGNGG